MYVRKSILTSTGGAAAFTGLPFDEKSRTAGDLTNPGTTSNAWVQLFTSAIELNVPAATGNRLVFGWNAMWSNAVNIWFDVATIVSNAVVNYISSGTSTPLIEGLPGLYPAIGSPVAGTRAGHPTYAVQAGDISSGTVTLRMVYKSSGITGSVFANSNFPYKWNVMNISRAV